MIVWNVFQRHGDLWPSRPREERAVETARGHKRLGVK